MFDANDKETIKILAMKKAQRMTGKFMANEILKSDAPESIKLSVQVMEKIRDIYDDALEEGIVLKYCTPTNVANVETLKKVLEYLELVEVGLNQFVESTPFVADETEEEEQC